MKLLDTLAARINKKSGVSDEELSAQLLHTRKALLVGTFYARVLTVAKSGESRTIGLAYKLKNRLIPIDNPVILKLAGCTKTGRIHGGGMDMLFYAQYNLFLSVCPDKDYTKFMPSYNNF